MNGRLATYVDYGREQLLLSRDRFIGMVWDDPPIVAEIISGTQKGSFAILRQDSFSIGGSGQEDLFVFCDTPEKPIHVETQKGPLGLFVTIRSDRTDIVLDGKKIEQGAKLNRAPCVLQFDGTEILIATESTEIQADAVQKRYRTGLLVIGIGIIALAWLSMTLVPKATRVAMVLPTGSAETEPSTDALIDVGQKISDAGFESWIDASSVDASTIQIHGSVPREREADWQYLQQQIDESLGELTLIKKLEQLTPLQNIPAISMVLLGDDPGLVLASGEMVELGDTLNENWMVDFIGKEHFSVSRSGESHNVSYE